LAFSVNPVNEAKSPQRPAESRRRLEACGGLLGDRAPYHAAKGVWDMRSEDEEAVRKRAKAAIEAVL
jgi:hypothetical protein